MANLSRLPAPLAASWDWQINAACREIDNTVFFHPTNERGEAKETRDNRAKAICLPLPGCRGASRHALAAREPCGVWGGLGRSDRRTHSDPARPANLGTGPGTCENR